MCRVLCLSTSLILKASQDLLAHTWWGQLNWERSQCHWRFSQPYIAFYWDGDRDSPLLSSTCYGRYTKLFLQLLFPVSVDWNWSEACGHLESMPHNLSLCLPWPWDWSQPWCVHRIVIEKPWNFLNPTGMLPVPNFASCSLDGDMFWCDVSIPVLLYTKESRECSVHLFPHTAQCSASPEKAPTGYLQICSLVQSLLSKSKNQT